jgi:hypothetical protein
MVHDIVGRRAQIVGIGRESPVVCMKYVGAVVVFHTLLAVSAKFF